MIWHILSDIMGIFVGVLIYHFIQRRRYKRFPDVKFSHKVPDLLSMGFVPTEWKDNESGEREITKMVLTHISFLPGEDGE